MRAGAMVYFYLDYEEQDSLEASLSFYEEDGTLIRSFNSKAEKDKDKLKIKPGSNTFVWNLRYPDAEKFKDMILWWSTLSGPKARYQETISLSWQLVKIPLNNLSTS